MTKNIKRVMASLGSIAILSSASVAHAQTLNIQSAGDFGGAHNNFPASNAIDGDTAFASRWAANFDNGGGDVNLFVDLGSVQRIDDIGVAWGRGNQGTYNFEVRARSGTSGSWTKIRDRADSSGDTDQVEVYNVTDIDARQVRIKVFSSTQGGWANVTEFEVYGTSGPSSSSSSSSSSSTSSSSTSSSSGSFGRIDVPARIEAEDFTDFSDSDTANRGGAYRDTAVDIQACGDSGCGFNIGWMNGGEWLEYDIDVQQSGDYEARVRTASTTGNGEFSIDINGSDRTGSISVDDTNNWQSYSTETVDIGSLSSGNQTLRFNVERSGLNLNWIELVRVDDTSSSSSSSSSSTSTSSTSSGSGDFNLNPNAAPWVNFDLTDWALDTPAIRSGTSNTSLRTTDEQFVNITAGRESIDSDQNEFFFTAPDGGMTFRSTVEGGTTGNGGARYTRSELREMLRRGDDDIEDTEPSPNNWQMGYADQNDDFGPNRSGGLLTATLRVDRVTTSGATNSHIGRMIVGQIHASGNEPARLYYRLLPGNTHGSIYIAHETSEDKGGDETYFEIIGSRSSSQDNPDNGIRLGELWSYEIEQTGALIDIVIRRGDRDGAQIASATIDMNELDSGYDDPDNWMYFKAGVYTQNDDADNGEFDQATFYRLENTH